MSDRYFRELATNQLYVKTEFSIHVDGVPDPTLFEELRAPGYRERYDSETGGWVPEEYDKDGNPYT